MGRLPPVSQIHSSRKRSFSTFIACVCGPAPATRQNAPQAHNLEPAPQVCNLELFSVVARPPGFRSGFDFDSGPETGAKHAQTPPSGAKHAQTPPQV